MRLWNYKFHILVWKVLKKAYRTFHVFCSTQRTHMLFWLNGVQSESIRAIGVPYVNVSLGGRVVVGKNLSIRTGCDVTEVGTVGSRILVGPHGCLRIGNHVGMSNCTLVAQESVSIGDDVLLGGGVQIFDTNFHSLDARNRCSTVPQDDRNHVKTAPVVIGNRVFIGTNALICKGVSIGDEAIVAAGSVVVHDIPPGEIWGGNPAQKLR